MIAHALPALSSWQEEADRRWPDGLDMAWMTGVGQWATLAWCGPLTVQLHATREHADQTLRGIEFGCGHGCWGDHEIVDLAEPEVIDPAVEYLRGPARAAHGEACRICQYWASGRLPRAAMRRASARRRRAA